MQKSQQKRGLLCFCFASKTVLPAIGCGICKYPLVLDFESNWLDFESNWLDFESKDCLLYRRSAQS